MRLAIVERDQDVQLAPVLIPVSLVMEQSVLCRSAPLFAEMD